MQPMSFLQHIDFMIKNPRLGCSFTHPNTFPLRFQRTPDASIAE